ncbi:MAG TPA: dienelactone hydrolase family protein [Longimicrobium sp.]
MRLLAPSLVLPLLFCAACQRPQPASRLETTPRHDEWVEVRSGDRVVHTYVVYPEVSRRAMAVVLIHENRGLTDWVRTVADRLAEEGYIAVAPDLLSGMAPGGGRTSGFPTQDAAREAIGRLPREQVSGDLRAVVEYARSIPAATGQVAVAGFCWGGARTWEIANEANLAAAYVFYGTGPRDAAGVAGISEPVYGFYGGNDARVNATIPASAELMRAAGKRFEPVTYDSAGHAFMRSGETPEGSAADRKARDEAWARWLRLLREAASART